MKKSLLSLITGIGMILTTTGSKAQVLDQGNMSFDPYYGVASIIAKSFFTAPDSAIGVSDKFIGPVGLRFEYMGSAKVGFGFEYNYTVGEFSWQETKTDTVTSVSKTYNYKIRRDLHRFMPRINIHFGGSETFDSYFGVAVGYRLPKWSITSDEPGYNYDTGSFSTFALRFALGARYYFTDNIGGVMELGLGGGTLLHLGLTIKI